MLHDDFDLNTVNHAGAIGEWALAIAAIDRPRRLIGDRLNHREFAATVFRWLRAGNETNSKTLTV